MELVFKRVLRRWGGSLLSRLVGSFTNSILRFLEKHRIFSVYGYKEIREVDVWVEIERGVRILERRLEPAEIYHKKE